MNPSTKKVEEKVPEQEESFCGIPLLLTEKDFSNIKSELKRYVVEVSSISSNENAESVCCPLVEKKRKRKQMKQCTK